MSDPDVRLLALRATERALDEPRWLPIAERLWGELSNGSITPSPKASPPAPQGHRVPTNQQTGFSWTCPQDGWSTRWRGEVARHQRRKHPVLPETKAARPPKKVGRPQPHPAPPKTVHLEEPDPTPRPSARRRGRSIDPTLREACSVCNEMVPTLDLHDHQAAHANGGVS